MTVAESKVSGIVKALGGLEDNLDSLDSTVADMKHQLTLKAQKEVAIMYEKVREMANQEAEDLVRQAKEKADVEAARISKEADSQLEQIRANIDSGFEDAVGVVVDTIMKP